MRRLCKFISGLLAGLSLVFSAAVAAQDAPTEPVARGLSDLDFVAEVLRRDYAGFEDKTQGEAAAEFDRQLELARNRIRERPDARIHAIDALIDWFEDQHLSISSNIQSPSDPYPGPTSPPRAAALRNLGEDFAFTRLSQETVMLRVPNFNLSNMRRFHALLEKHHDTITSTPNLLIDMRFNGGGGDSVYEPLMAYLYTRPIYSIGAELRASEANIATFESYASDERLDPDTRAFVQSIVDRARAGNDEWVGFDERGFAITTFPKVYEFPRRVGILAEGAGSAGDQFVIDARFSRKVTLLGGPTAGVIDYSNVNGVSAPSGDFVLGYPMTRTLRLPEEPFDNVGVPPDVPFGDEVEDHIAAAQAWLERQVD